MTEAKKVEIERIRAAPVSAQESMAQLIDDLVLTYQGTRLASHSPGSMLGDFVKRSRAGSVHLEFPEDGLPLQVEFEQGLRRFNHYWRTRIEHGGRPINKRDRRSVGAKGRRHAVLGEVGIDPIAVSFIYGLSSESVEQMRGNNGRDPKTGERVEAQHKGRIGEEPTSPKPITSQDLPPGF